MKPEEMIYELRAVLDDIEDVRRHNAILKEELTLAIAQAVGSLEYQHTDKGNKEKSKEFLRTTEIMLTAGALVLIWNAEAGDNKAYILVTEAEIKEVFNRKAK